jgi:hypothetical protein
VYARSPEDVAKAWRDRLAGRSRREPRKAAAAIGVAYRQAGLAPPKHILWADGPQEAMQAVAFLRTPPRVLWRFAALLAVVGAAAWVGLALAIAHHLIAAPTNGDVVAFAATLSAFVVVLGSLRPVPIPPRLVAVPRHREIIAWGAALLIIALQPVACATLLQLGATDLSPPALIGVLILAGALGALPGLLLAARVYAVHRVLPPHLKNIGPAVPAGGALRRARDEAWAPFRQQILYAAWSDRLPTRGRRNAHALAFRDEPAGVFPPDGSLRALGTREDTSAPLFSDWLARVFEPRLSWEAPSHHLDGVEDATRAAAVACTGTGTGTGDAALAFAGLAFYLDRLYPFQGIAVAAWPATHVALDGEERLHSDHGPALAWRDGTAVYLWHGQLVDADLIDDGRPPTLSRIALEREPNRRRVLIERFGLGRYMSQCGATEIHRDACGVLYRLDQRLDEPIIAVRVANATPGPDGVFEEFWLRVPPSMRTATEAVAWTFGLSPEEYTPLLQS